MIYVRARLLLMILFFALGILLNLQLGWESAWYLYAAGFILLFTQVRFGPVWAAFVELRKGKWEEAENILGKVWNPKWLSKRHSAYYHFTKGMVAVQRKQQEIASGDLKKAVELGLRNKTDEALALLNLAFIELESNRNTQAKAFLEQAKALKVNNLLVTKRIQEMESTLLRQN